MSSVDNAYYALRANEQIFAVLETSKSLTDRIFDELPMVLIILDQYKKILKINRNGQAALNVSEAEFLGQEVGAILPQNCVNDVDAYFDEYHEEAENNPNLLTQKTTNTTRAAGIQKGQSSVRRSFEYEIMIGEDKRYFFWQICQVFQDRDKQVHILIGNDTTDARTVFEEMLLLNKDIEIAGTAQSLLLPKNEFKDTSFFKMAAFYEPAAKVGGDLWWDDWSDGRYFAVVADVMGHGIGSAMVSSIAGGALNALSIKNDLRTVDDIRRLLEDLHRIIFQICDGRYFICMSALTFSEESDEATLFMAGTPPIVHFPKGDKKKSLCKASTPIGMSSEQSKIEAMTIPFRPGDRLVCMTDGCYEFRVDGKQYGRRNFVKLIEQHNDLEPHTLSKKIGSDLKVIRNTEFADDDVTFLIVERC